MNMTREEAAGLTPGMLTAHCYGAGGDVAEGSDHSNGASVVLDEFVARLDQEAEWVGNFAIAPFYDRSRGLRPYTPGDLVMSGLVHETLRRKYGRTHTSSELSDFIGEVKEVISQAKSGNRDTASKLDAFFAAASTVVLQPAA